MNQTVFRLRYFWPDILWFYYKQFKQFSVYFFESRLLFFSMFFFFSCLKKHPMLLIIRIIWTISMFIWWPAIYWFPRIYVNWSLSVIIRLFYPLNENRFFISKLSQLLFGNSFAGKLEMRWTIYNLGRKKFESLAIISCDLYLSDRNCWSSK